MTIFVGYEYLKSPGLIAFEMELVGGSGVKEIAIWISIERQYPGAVSGLQTTNLAVKPVSPLRITEMNRSWQESDHAQLHGGGGERGIRTPGTLLTYTHFPGVLFRPLRHLSAVTVSAIPLAGVSSGNSNGARNLYQALTGNKRLVSWLYSTVTLSMCQATLSDVGLVKYRKKTRKKPITDDMKKNIPWKELAEAMELFYPMPGNAWIGGPSETRRCCVSTSFSTGSISRIRPQMRLCTTPWRAVFLSQWSVGCRWNNQGTTLAWS